MARRAIRTIGSMCGVTFTVTGTEQLVPTRAYLLVPEPLEPVSDIPAVLLAVGDIRFLAAAELFRVPLLASAMRALDTEPVERRDPAQAYRQLAALAGRDAPRRLAIFAEGGTSRPPVSVGRSRTAPFVLAAQTKVEIVPVAILGSSDVLAPRGRLKVRPGVIAVDLLTPVAAPDGSETSRNEVRDRVQAAVLAQLAAGPRTAATRT